MSYYTEGFKCARENDNSTCYFTGITESYYFYSDLETYSRVDSNRPLIKNIYFKNSKMNNIPKELTIYYKSLTILDASKLRLSRVENQDFFSDCKIQHLNASYNKIHEIPKGLNNGMRDLSNLDLSHNIIDRIDDEAFNYKENLKFLNLSNNRIGKISMSFLYNLRGLEILKLDNNRITEITGYVEDLSMNLKELYLQNNNLKQFYPRIIPSATYLDISFNEIEDDLDFSTSKLIELYVKSNLLPSLKINRELQILDASDNEEKTFKINFNSKTDLKKLSLSNLDIPSFKNILKSTQNLHNLTFLDLSKNSLGNFDLADLYLPSVETLSLRQCSIFTFKNWDELLNIFSRLKSIDIRGNYIKCEEMQSIVDKFRESGIIAGLKDQDEKDFVKKNCASDHHKHKEQEFEDKKVEVKVLWAFLILFLLGYVAGACYFVNKRYGIISRLKERNNKISYSNHHEIDTSQFSNIA